MRLRLTLEARLAALMLGLMLAAGAAAALLARLAMRAPRALTPWGYVGLAAAALLLAVWAAHRAFRPVRGLLRALAGAVASYRDGDFSFSLRIDRDDELGELQAAHNELGRALREQRAQLLQRELLLDTVTQNSPVALVLVDAHRRVVYANLSARQLLGLGRSLTGLDFDALLAQAPEALSAAAAAGDDTLFSVELEGEDETFHLSQRGFLLRGVPHRLYLLKRLTRELSRQEVATWKKLIRVLSHELNNSLAPIASLAQSGGELLRREELQRTERHGTGLQRAGSQRAELQRGEKAGQTANLDKVFAAIGERAGHLHHFISGYAAFAKLPAPRPQWVAWPDLIGELGRQQRCRIAGPLPEVPGWFDRAQLEQALINLLKNAREAGGASSEVEIAVRQLSSEQQIEVRDRGPGMSETVLAQALLPFYSTKRQGTGLGLALTREIVEAHGGRIRLANREGGGLCVTLTLPVPASIAS